MISLLWLEEMQYDLTKWQDDQTGVAKYVNPCVLKRPSGSTVGAAWCGWKKCNVI